MNGFDDAYYRRFYGDPATRVIDAEGLQPRVDLVCAWLRYLDIEVGSVLDFGAGPGLWKDALVRRFPEASYLGIEVSETMCRAHGWTLGSVADFEAPAPADLVICNDVLQYLGDDDARNAIVNLARHTRGALVLQVLTRRDWDENCDQSLTDGKVFHREGSWYRHELARYFRNCGSGLFVPRSAPTVLFELEEI